MALELQNYPECCYRPCAPYAPKATASAPETPANRTNIWPEPGPTAAVFSSFAASLAYFDDVSAAFLVSAAVGNCLTIHDEARLTMSFILCA